MLEIPRQPALVAGREIAQPERGLRVDARGVDEILAIGRNHRLERAAVFVRPHDGSPGGAIEHRDLITFQRVLCLERRAATARDLNGVVHVATIRRERIRTAGRRIGIRRLPAPTAATRRQTDDGNAAAAVLVVHHAIGDDVLAVGRPHRLHRSSLVITRDLSEIPSVDVRDPNLIVACTVGDEEDLFAVRRVTRLNVECHAAHQAGGFAARDRHRIQIAEQVEDDRPAIR